MELTQLRTSAIDKFMDGNPEPLVEIIRRNELNDTEKNFLAKLVRENIPRGNRGPKPKSDKPLRAALIRFWLQEIEGWSEADAVLKEIENKIGVSKTMARKYLSQIDDAKTPHEERLCHRYKLQTFYLEARVAGGDENLIRECRDYCLKPIID